MIVLHTSSLIATTVLSLLFSSKLVATVPHNHQLVHRHMPRTSPAHDLITLGRESVGRRDAALNIGDQERMTAADFKKMRTKCRSGGWPLPPSIPMPIIEQVANPPAQLDLFSRPESYTPNALTMYNYCPYDVYFVHWNGDKPFEDVDGTTLAAGESVTRALTGTVMKVHKSTALDWPLQIEYSGYYDMSLINCLGTTDGMPLNSERPATITADTSRCAGHEAGLHLSQPEGRAFQCEAGLWCDGQAYFYEEQLCKPTRPNKPCQPSVASID